jgi:hypothetical protein
MNILKNLQNLEEKNLSDAAFGATVRQLLRLKELEFGHSDFSFDEYQGLTDETNIYSESIRKYVGTLEIPSELKAANLRQLLNVTYVALGMAGEAGELCNKLKKIIRDNNATFTAENLEDLRKENGDVTWYNAQFFSRIGTAFSEGAKMNLSKLFNRKKQNTLSGSGDNR